VELLPDNPIRSECATLAAFVIKPSYQALIIKGFALT
jgi:hypothetical protein